jgi:pilus assembly protein CpaE
MNPLSLIIYSERPEFAARFEAIAEKIECVRLGGCADDPESYERLRKSEEPLALLVDLSPDPNHILEELESLSNVPPLLYMAGPQHESAVILRAMRLGAREFFSDMPSLEEVESVFRAALEAAPVQPESNENARVISVIGAKGGVGATTVTCQLAFALRALGKRTAILDLNLPLGDVALHCDVTPIHTLANMTTERESADATYVAKLLEKHATGLHVMASPHRIEEAEAVTAEHVETVLYLLRDQFDWIVMDVSRAWNEVSIRALDLSDLIVAVSVTDLPALRHLKQHLALMERLGHKQENVRLVANRCSKKHDGLDKKDFMNFIGRAVDFEISNDFSTVASAIDAGCPVTRISTNARVTREFESLAQQVHTWCGLENENRLNQTARSGFRKFFRR